MLRPLMSIYRTFVRSYGRIIFMELFKLHKDKLSTIESKPFKLERDIQKVIEDNCEELFGLQFVKSEFAINGYRLDSLCFDEETNSFVIIEYKKGSSYSVVDQGYTYLSTMLNNKSDFVLEYNESTESNLLVSMPELVTKQRT